MYRQRSSIIHEGRQKRENMMNLPPPNFQWNGNVQRQKAQPVILWNQGWRSEFKSTSKNTDVFKNTFQREIWGWRWGGGISLMT